MSRVGKRILNIPENVEVTLTSKNNSLLVKGPLGQLEKSFVKDIKITIKDNKISTSVEKQANRQTNMNFGTVNSLIEAMLLGVSKGFKKELEIKGVGYNVVLQGTNKLVFSLGKSHKDEMIVPSNLKVEVKSPTEFSVFGIDKQFVGQFASICKKLRKPEPYGGKGIRYKGEIIKLKAGKVAK